MIYASVVEFKSIGVSSIVYKDYSDAQIEAFLSDASDHINGFLRVTYDTISVDDAKTLRRICINIAAYYLLVHRGFDIDNSMDQTLKINYDNAIAQLVLIQKQNIKLDNVIKTGVRPQVI